MSYHISAERSRLKDPATLSESNREREFLDLPDGRQLLHVTFGSVLTFGTTPEGRSFKDAILETLAANPALHHQLLADHLGCHIQLLQAG